MLHDLLYIIITIINYRTLYSASPDIGSKTHCGTTPLASSINKNYIVISIIFSPFNHTRVVDDIHKVYRVSSARQRCY